MIVLAALILAQQESAPAVLVAPAGFSVDLVDSAPKLCWPSAVHCLADGSLLVAEDPMDMPGPTDQPLDRVWLYRWKEDGSFTRTLFAEKLFASFGLEEIDGAVYVMNMPHLTVLRDVDGDGVAEDRRELLTDLGPVAPGHPGGFNDHIISGLRYGMDGYLYVACGDKGIPLARGTDGSTLTLRGGGVIRMRPDGSKLEVVASGLRNILDVAMDANGEMFTYDNTDDGLGWWTRLTHIVPGGYYGYPWDYHGDARRFLAPMAEYGGGSPTGGLVKREGGWPAPYEGSLFFCEWGDMTLRRFQLERDGGTFKVEAMEEFLQPGKVADFHPTDVCESPDGRFLYVSDWGFGGWESKEVTGRLWRVRKSEDDGRAPGGVSARVGKDASITQRISSEGWRTRLLAQSEIVLKQDLGSLQAALKGNERSKVHALNAARELLQVVLHPASAIDQRALLMDILDRDEVDSVAVRRVGNATKHALESMMLAGAGINGGHPLQGSLESGTSVLANDEELSLSQDALASLVSTTKARWVENAEARAAAWKVAGESAIAKHSWRKLAASRLTPVQFAKFFEDGESQALELLDAVQSVVIRSGEMRRGALEDNPPRGPFEDLEASGILALARGEKAGSNPRIRAAALHTLAVLARVCEPWDGKWWSIAPAKSPRPARTLDWKGTELANATIVAALSDPQASTRIAAAAALLETHDSRLAPPLRARIEIEPDAGARSKMLETLGEIGSKDDVGIFARIARESKDTEERLNALRIGTRIGAQEMGPVAAWLVVEDATEDRVCAAAIEMLSALAPARLKELGLTFDAALNRSRHASSIVRRASCALLANLDSDRALPRLFELLHDTDTHSAAFRALASVEDPRAARAYARELPDSDPELRSLARRTIAHARKKLRPALEGMVQRQEFSGAIVRELRSIYASHRPIPHWDLCGPFAVDSENGKLDFASEHAAASKQRLETTKRIATESKRADGMIDLRALLGAASNQTAYAFGEWQSETEGDVELHVGSDDQVAVWLNGVLVHEFDGARSFAPEADRFKVHALAGKNTVVLRIGQNAGDWSFALAVPEPAKGPIFEIKLPAQPTAAEYAAYAAAQAGDAGKGDVVLRDVNRTTCLRCHSVGGVGEHVGPDLAGLGARYSRTEIIASILSPSQRILDGYAAVSVLTKDDRMFFGQIKRDDAAGILLVDTTGTPITIDREDVAEVRPSKLSVMPDGLCNTMTPAEFADLIAALARG